MKNAQEWNAQKCSRMKNAQEILVTFKRNYHRKSG